MINRDAERRMQEAQRLLDEPLLIEAFQLIEERAVDDMLSIKGWRWADKRRRLAAERVNAIRGLRAHLIDVVSQGKSANRLRAIA